MATGETAFSDLAPASKYMPQWHAAPPAPAPASSGGDRRSAAPAPKPRTASRDWLRAKNDKPKRIPSFLSFVTRNGKRAVSKRNKRRSESAACSSRTDEDSCWEGEDDNGYCLWMWDDSAGDYGCKPAPTCSTHGSDLDFCEESAYDAEGYNCMVEDADDGSEACVSDRPLTCAEKHPDDENMQTKCDVKATVDSSVETLLSEFEIIADRISASAPPAFRALNERFASNTMEASAYIDVGLAEEFFDEATVLAQFDKTTVGTPPTQPTCADETQACWNSWDTYKEAVAARNKQLVAFVRAFALSVPMKKRLAKPVTVQAAHQAHGSRLLLGSVRTTLCFNDEVAGQYGIATNGKLPVDGIDGSAATFGCRDGMLGAEFYEDVLSLGQKILTYLETGAPPAVGGGNAVEILTGTNLAIRAAANPCLQTEEGTNVLAAIRPSGGTDTQTCAALAGSAGGAAGAGRRLLSASPASSQSSASVAFASYDAAGPKECPAGSKFKKAAPTTSAAFLAQPDRCWNSHLTGKTF